MKKSMVVSTKTVVPGRSKGFTLIELMVALTILGILLAAGVPGMRTLLANMDVRSTTDQLVNGLAYARGEAVAQTINTTICPTTDDATCSGTNWTRWVVFNTDNNTVLRVGNHTASGVGIAGGPARIDFDEQGDNLGAQVTFTFSKTGASNRQIRVSTVGYTSIL